MRPLARVMGQVTAGLLAVIAALHAYWAAGGRAGTAAVIPDREDGRPLFRMEPAGAGIVAVLLLGAALTVLARLGLCAGGVPERWPRRGTWALAAVFASRAVGDFRYAGAFKRVRGTRFARWDSRLYSPLCALLALGCALAAYIGPERER